MKDIKFCLIGCGRISKNHVEAAKTIGIQIQAMCDLDLDAMRLCIQKSEQANMIKQYRDYIEMLESEKPDLVAIATDSGSHAVIALECIRRGVHVIVEKPMALSMVDTRRIIEQSQLNNVKVSVCHQNRYNKAVQLARSSIESGALGKLMHSSATIRWNRDRNYYKQAPWRGTWAQDGGALMNQCIHNIDLLRWLLNDEIDEVFAYTDRLTHDYIEAEDFGVGLIKFKNGAYGIIEGSTSIYPSNYEETLCVFGTDGSIKIGGKSVNKIEHWQVRGSSESDLTLKKQFDEEPPDVYGYGHTALYADMVRAIEEDRTPYITAIDGKNAVELVLAIYKSAAERRSVKLPLENTSTTDFVNKFGKVDYSL